MLQKLIEKEVIFDDEICLLKPLGFNYVTFFHCKMNSIMKFHPSLNIIVKSF